MLSARKTAGFCDSKCDMHGEMLLRHLMASTFIIMSLLGISHVAGLLRGDNSLLTINVTKYHSALSRKIKPNEHASSSLASKVAYRSTTQSSKYKLRPPAAAGFRCRRKMPLMSLHNFTRNVSLYCTQSVSANLFAVMANGVDGMKWH